MLFTAPAVRLDRYISEKRSCSQSDVLHVAVQNQLKMFTFRFFPPSDVLLLIKLTVLQLLSSLHLSVKDGVN